MTPRRVLPREPDHQIADDGRCPWPTTGSGPLRRAGPMPSDRLSIPSQQRPGRHDPDSQQIARQHPRQRGQQKPLQTNQRRSPPAVCAGSTRVDPRLPVPRPATSRDGYAPAGRTRAAHTPGPSQNVPGRFCDGPRRHSRHRGPRRTHPHPPGLTWTISSKASRAQPAAACPRQVIGDSARNTSERPACPAHASPQPSAGDAPLTAAPPRRQPAAAYAPSSSAKPTRITPSPPTNDLAAQTT
jgi:hypothetical protein